MHYKVDKKFKLFFYYFNDAIYQQQLLDNSNISSILYTFVQNQKYSKLPIKGEVFSKNSSNQKSLPKRQKYDLTSFLKKPHLWYCIQLFYNNIFISYFQVICSQWLLYSDVRNYVAMPQPCLSSHWPCLIFYFVLLICH